MSTRTQQKNTAHEGAQEHFCVSVKRALLTHPRFTTLSELARSLGYHRNTVSRAIHRNTMPRVRKAVARALHLPISTR